jgi:RluA family pseudouridine synthase
MISIVVHEKEAGSRLDRILRKQLPLLSLSSIYSMIRRGAVRVAGHRKINQDYRLVLGDIVNINADHSELALPAEKREGVDSRLVKTDFFKRSFSILHEDHDLLVCNKPVGLVVHPGSGHLHHDTLVDLAAAYLFAGGKIKDLDDFALVHRLDRDTSGAILVAKNKQALRRLHEMFRRRSLTKQYIAICHGRPRENEGEIELHLQRGRDARGETTMHVQEKGVLSRSRYRIDAFSGDRSRIEVFLETGKTHQIRIHLSHLGAPILGDSRYGDSLRDKMFFLARPGFTVRLYLHAWKLSFLHPSTMRPFTVTAPLPYDFAEIMEDRGRVLAGARA